ncbi:MAG: hypothetical protein H0T79_06050 [Deltaproteobacteria bacterium]|nr:hypothetical protein [Deltaproteobacteria bacterium]
MQTDFIHRYFEAERRQMLALVTGAVALTAAALVLVLRMRDSCSKVLLVTVAIVAVLFKGALAATSGSQRRRGAHDGDQRAAAEQGDRRGDRSGRQRRLQVRRGPLVATSFRLALTAHPAPERIIDPVKRSAKSSCMNVIVSYNQPWARS